jgi:hypothetical protein
MLAPFGLGQAAGDSLVGAGVAFYAVFGVFVVAFAFLSFVSVRWALRRDRAGRAEWLRRQQQPQRHPRQQARSVVDDRLRCPVRKGRVPPPQTNGHRPRRPDHRGRESNQPG